MAVVKYLCLDNNQQLSVQDVHGNTPLRYLTFYRSVNIELLEWLRLFPGGDHY